MGATDRHLKYLLTLKARSLRVTQHHESDEAQYIGLGPNNYASLISTLLITAHETLRANLRRHCGVKQAQLKSSAKPKDLSRMGLKPNDILDFVCFQAPSCDRAKKSL